jgi:hypothetical protein
MGLQAKEPTFSWRWTSSRTSRTLSVRPPLSRTGYQFATLNRQKDSLE